MYQCNETNKNSDFKKTDINLKVVWDNHCDARYHIKRYKISYEKIRDPIPKDTRSHTRPHFKSSKREDCTCSLEPLFYSKENQGNFIKIIKYLLCISLQWPMLWNSQQAYLGTVLIADTQFYCLKFDMVIVVQPITDYIKSHGTVAYKGFLS